MNAKKEQINESSNEVATLSTDEVYEFAKTTSEGLSNEEAKERQEKEGKNILQEAKEKPLFLVFLGNFISLMAVLLWIGGIIAIFADMPQLGISIWMVNLVNGLFSFWQEFRAGKATDALKKMLPSYCRVIRKGKEDKILAEDLVVGDIILIEEGDKISSDARLIAANDLQINQSTLTGESNPVRKAAIAENRENISRFEIHNLIFAGTTVSSGTGKAVVTAIAMNTEFGKIANLTQNMKEEKSPLQKELDILTKQISLIAMAMGLFFFLAGYYFVGQPFALAFVFALGMVVAFIPEGLLPTVTLSLAMAVQRMAKEHALVKKLSAVETLGSTSVICSDKTGTLTKNEMTVNYLWLPTKELEVTGLGYASEGTIVNSEQKTLTIHEDVDLLSLVKGAAFCSNARIIEPNEENPNYTVLGDPTEACLGVVATKAKFDIEEELRVTPRLRELPFDSNRKRMTTIHQLDETIKGANRIAYVKGAPKEVMELCNYIQIDGEVQKISDEQRSSIMEANDNYARNGLRVLAVAHRLISKETNLPVSLSAYTPEVVEQDLTFIGLVVMSDPARPEVSAAVEICHKANIRIIMITGDYGLTAESIAKRIGIVKSENPRVVSGSELAAMSDDQLKIALKDEIIFARVAPEQKYRIVSNLQEMKNIVAVTGDGVNDAPALKKANIGVAMGITGTDVAKEAADMILTDDNFASIVTAIEEGRAVYSNIQKFMVYILNSNMAEAVPSALFLFSRGLIPLPLTVMQILAIDLGTDMFPALGLGTENPEEGLMDHPPRTHKDRLLNKKAVFKAFFWYGLLEAILAMGAYFLVNMHYGWPNASLVAEGYIYRQACAMTFAAIVFAQIGAVLNCRTVSQSIFKVGIFSNKKVIFGIVFEICLVIAMMYVPILQEIFGTAPIPAIDWIYLILIPIPMIAVDEVRKKIIRNKKAKAKGEKN